MKLYVGNLPFNFSDEDLAALFRRHGVVDTATIVMDRDTGRSRGFGFVEMPDADEARKAIEETDGTDAGGRRLTVNEARPREDRGRRPGGGGGGGGNRGGGGGYGRDDRRDRRY
jgi:RNA recognition motif-containing protein